MNNIKLNSKQTAIIRSLNNKKDDLENQKKVLLEKMVPFSNFCLLDKKDGTKKVLIAPTAFEKALGETRVTLGDGRVSLDFNTSREVLLEVLNECLKYNEVIDAYNEATKDTFLEGKVPSTGEEFCEKLTRLYNIIYNCVYGNDEKKNLEMSEFTRTIERIIMMPYDILLTEYDKLSNAIEIIDKIKNKIANKVQVELTEEENSIIEEYLSKDEYKKFNKYNSKLSNKEDKKANMSDEEYVKDAINRYEKILGTIKSNKKIYQDLLSKYRNMCINLDNPTIVKQKLYNYLLSINDSEKNKQVITEFLMDFMHNDAKHPNFIKLIQPTIGLQSADKTKFIREPATSDDFDVVIEIIEMYIELLKVGDLSSVIVKNVLDKLTNCMVDVLDKTKALIENYDISIKNFEKFIKGLKYGNRINFIKEDEFVKFNLNAPKELEDGVKEDIAKMISYVYSHNDKIRRLKKGITDDSLELELTKKKKKKTKISVPSKAEKKIDGVVVETQVNSSSNLENEINISSENVDTPSSDDYMGNGTFKERKESEKLEKIEEIPDQPAYVVCTPDEVTLELQKIKSAKKSAMITKTSIVKTLKKNGYEMATKKLKTKVKEIAEKKKDDNILLFLNYLLEIECEKAKNDIYYAAGDVTYYRGNEDEYLSQLFELMCDCSDYIEDKTGVYYDGSVAIKLFEKIEKKRK